MDKGRRKYIKTNKGDKVNTSCASSPILQAFKEFSSELDEKHDKYERLIKLSRDVTIGSKRIIFSLHALMRSNQYEEDVQKIIGSFRTIRQSFLKNIALEVRGTDPYQFLRAFSPGLQEYIEAITYYNYIINGKLFNFEEMVEDLSFKLCENEDVQKEQTVSRSGEESLHLVLPLTEYLLGIQDLTGELMRHCINSFGAGNVDSGFTVCNFVKQLYTGLMLLGNVHSREYSKKVYIARQSLEKMEMACYTSHVRGSEAVQFQPDPDQPPAHGYSLL